MQVFRALCPAKALPGARSAVVRTLYDPAKAAAVDAVLDPGALVLFFPKPHSVTGEDVLELHVHGGRAVVQAVLAAIPRACTPPSSGRIRYAEPGEFTRRAFLNGRLDLTQVEALGDTLAAVTEQQRRLSVRGTASKLGKTYEAWRQLLLEARGELEALIDFSEDQHFDESPAALVSSVAALVGSLRSQIGAYSDNAVRGELLRNGLALSLLGAPNVGKSSLLNLVLGREAAIVSGEEGTTRDVIEVGVDIGGWYCRLVDMAGLRRGRHSHDGRRKEAATGEGKAIGEVELEGIRRARQKALDSDVVIVVLSVEHAGSGDGQTFLPVSREVMETAARCSERPGQAVVVVVVNKLDRMSCEAQKLPDQWMQQIQESLPNLSRDRIFGVSCKRAHEASSDDADAGRIQSFLSGLVRVFKDLTSPATLQDGERAAHPLMADAWEESLGASKRQKMLLDGCLGHLDGFLRHVTRSADGEPSVDVVVAAESLRAAAESLGKITGKGEAGDVEEVLGVIFERYCVGK